mmetsp:Transcript_12627/g.19862  ORF Transcript_12627/g.19862 Transcript_12627/m.19862 type:complete len:122 (+) Transcript_12627:810-1175(+)
MVPALAIGTRGCSMMENGLRTCDMAREFVCTMIKGRGMKVSGWMIFAMEKEEWLGLKELCIMEVFSMITLMAEVELTTQMGKSLKVTLKFVQNKTNQSLEEFPVAEAGCPFRGGMCIKGRS